MERSIENAAAIERNDRSWTAALAPYRCPSAVRSTVEIAIIALPFVALWVLTGLAVVNGIWWGLLLTVPAASFLVRLFILQHDCGHGALFGRRGLDDWIGSITLLESLRCVNLVLWDDETRRLVSFRQARPTV